MKEAPLVRNPELGTSPNGNGSASGGSHSQTPFDHKPRSLWKTFFTWAGVSALLAAAGLLGYLKFTPHGKAAEKTFREFVPAVIQAKQNPDLVFERANSDIVNILLIGRDVNWVVKKVYDPSRKIWATMQVHDEETPARSDTMLIVSLDRTRKTIHMVSLPRDARVHMPENQHGVRRAKLNAAHAYGGPEMLVQTIRDELGITIHHYAVIRFEGFKKLIDQVGGVEVDVIGALQRDGTRGRLKYDDNWGNLHIDLKPGKQVLDGEKAHSYVRFRMDTEGDPGRIKRQQQVMRALARKLTSQPLWNIAPLVQEIRKQFKTDPHFEAAQIASAADFAKNIGDPSKIQPLTLFGVYGTRGSLILNDSKNRKLLRYIFGPTFNESAFLQNSPSTENDEMGEENNSSPGAKAILRRAGVIGGGEGESTVGMESSDQSSHSEVSQTFDSEAERSRLAIAGDSTVGDSMPQSSVSEERPRRSSRTRRRSTRRERGSDENSSMATDNEQSSHSQWSTPAEDSAPAGDGADSGDDSPVPAPEEHAGAPAGDSPVPRAE